MGTSPSASRLHPRNQASTRPARRIMLLQGRQSQIQKSASHLGPVDIHLLASRVTISSKCSTVQKASWISSDGSPTQRPSRRHRAERVTVFKEKCPRRASSPGPFIVLFIVTVAICSGGRAVRSGTARPLSRLAFQRSPSGSPPYCHRDQHRRRSRTQVPRSGE